MDRRPARPMRDHLADALHALRTNAGVGLREFAESIGMSAGHLSHVEKGHKPASKRLVNAYIDHFGGEALIESLFQAEEIEREQILNQQYGSNATEPRERRDVSIQGDASRFIRADVDPSAVVSSGEFFTVTFHLENSGVVDWENRYLKRMGSPASMALPWSPLKVAIPATKPGSVAEIPIPVRGAPLPGTAQILFKMADADGNLFFPSKYRYGVLITVTTVPTLPTSK